MSGKAAQKMAEKMKGLAEHIQVICISHLPQVASMSDHHLFISKIKFKLILSFMLSIDQKSCN